MRIIEHIIGYIAPYSCVLCDTEGVIVCTPCTQRIFTPYQIVVPSMDAATALAPYDGTAKKLITALKYEHNREVATVVATAMSRAISDTTAVPTIITWVPTAPPRVRERGFDHAGLIAVALAKQLKVPCLSLLGRTANTRQVGTNRATRLKQVTGLFYVRQPALLTNARILVVDDVTTTGASIAEAARTLRAAGAEHIEGMVCAAA